MSPNRRILLNIVSTYGRSLYALVCGLFISRLVVAALGSGLDDVVGGMTMVVAVACGGFVAVCRAGISPVLTPETSRMPDFIGRDEFLEVK